MARDFKARIHTLFIGPDHLLHGIINLESVSIWVTIWDHLQIANMGLRIILDKVKCSLSFSTDKNVPYRWIIGAYDQAKVVFSLSSYET